MATNEPIELTVITPERQVLSQQTDSVVVPAHDGELGILELRAALMCELGIGQLRYHSGGQEHRVYIDGGFAQVLGNHVTVLTTHAIPAGEITAEQVSEAEQAVATHKGYEPDTMRARERAQRRASVMRSMLSGSPSHR